MLSDLFFTINFSISIFSSIIGLLFAFTIIVTVIYYRPCHSINNLLTCNTCFIAGLYFVANLISSIYGLREDWALNQPACVFRAYIFLVTPLSLCYSCAIQAVSRLLYVVFYKRKYLFTYRVHQYLIVFSWLFGNISTIAPLFVENGFTYEPESRYCIVNVRQVITTMFCLMAGFFVPFNLVIVIYTIIFYHVHQSARRIDPATTNTIKMTILACGGLPCAAVALLHAAEPSVSLTESIYLLRINTITIFTAVMMATSFIMNSQVKNTVFSYLSHGCKPVLIESTIQRNMFTVR